MSVLIKGMEKPHNCLYCPLSVLNGERLFCEITKDEVLRSKIAQGCPLIEVPHGSLIDADKVKNAICKYVDEYGTIEIKITKFNIILERAQLPTIIEAEEAP